MYSLWTIFSELIGFSEVNGIGGTQIYYYILTCSCRGISRIYHLENKTKNVIGWERVSGMG